MQGEVTQEQFQSMQNQMNSVPPEQLNQVKNMVSQNVAPMQANQQQNKTFNGGF